VVVVLTSLGHCVIMLFYEALDAVVANVVLTRDTCNQLIRRVNTFYNFETSARYPRDKA